MGLNVKAAISICLGFISSMAWLVNQVARPIVQLPSPLTARAPLFGERGPMVGAAALPATRSLTPVDVAGRFVRPSLLAAERQADSTVEHALMIARAPEPIVGPPRRFLPPLRSPAEPRRGGDAVGGAGRVQLVSAEETLLEPAEEVGHAVAPGEADAGADSAKSKRYRVRRGDSLTRIAQREWKSKDPKLVWALVLANPQLKGRPDRILVGEELTIPDLTWAREALAAADKPAAVSLAGAPGDSKASGRTETVRWYTIRKHDSLASIARRRLNDHRRWREIAELNGLRNANRILPGMRIKLPPAARGAGNTAT